jgi:hypothetical protein
MGETTCMYQVYVDNAQHLTIAQFLIGTETILSVDSFLKYIIRQIEAIKFTYDWRIQSGCPEILSEHSHPSKSMTVWQC